MTDSNNSERWLRQHLSRRAALRAAILGATIPGALYLAKAADSADAADDNIYIPGAPNFLELGHGWPGKETNAGKITYRQWSDALDIVGAGTAPANRKVKIWDDLYVGGLLNLRTYWVEPEVPRTWTAFIYARDINGQTKPFWKDATGTAQPLVARSATLVVAASNASPRSKLGADYVCDGTADEVEINAAIAALPSSGGKVVLTEGQFNIAAHIINLAKPNVALVGQGWEATKIASTSAMNEAVYTNQDYVRFADFTLDCSDQTGGNALKIQGSYGCFERLRIANAKDCALHIYEDYHQVRDCIFSGGIGTVLLDNSDYCLVSGNRFVNTSTYHAIAIKGLHNTVIGNTLTGCYGGITFQPPSSDCVVANNVIEGQSGDTPAIHLMGQDRISVRGNVIRDCTGNGIDTASPGDCCIIEGNLISKISSPTEGRGILFGGTGTVVSNNVCEMCDLEGIVGHGDHCTIVGNICKNNGQRLAVGRRRGISLDTNATYCLVANNRCYDDQAVKTQDWGLYVTDPGTDHNYIADNDFRGNGQGAVGTWTPGVNNVFRNNLGYATENKGAATIPDGQTTSRVGHGLAVTPSSVVLTARANASIWVTNVDSSGFTANRQGTSGPIDFYWYAEV